MHRSLVVRSSGSDDEVAPGTRTAGTVVWSPAGENVGSFAVQAEPDPGRLVRDGSSPIAVVAGSVVAKGASPVILPDAEHRAPRAVGATVVGKVGRIRSARALASHDTCATPAATG